MDMTIAPPPKSRISRQWVLLWLGFALFVGVGLWFMFPGAPEDEAALLELVEQAESSARSGDAEALAELCWPPEDRPGMVEPIRARVRLLLAPGFELKRLGGEPSFTVAGERASAPVRYEIVGPGDNLIGDVEFTLYCVKHEGEWLVDYARTRESEQR